MTAHVPWKTFIKLLSQLCFVLVNIFDSKGDSFLSALTSSAGFPSCHSCIAHIVDLFEINKQYKII